MKLSDFRQAGHWPTLLCAFLYFDVSFMIWVLMGALSTSIALDYPLSPFEMGLLVATPLLGGAIIRVVLGVMSDHFGARRIGLIGMCLTMLPLLMGWLWGSGFLPLLLIGLLLGVAGASFAVALPLASRWYPPKYQGLAMGIAGAGNSGTALATFFGPRLAELIGWHAVFGLALLPLSLVLGMFFFLAKDSPKQPPAKCLSDYLAILGIGDMWRLCLLYSVTFGGFVGLASFLSYFFHHYYDLTRVQAGTMVTLCVIAGSFLRPVGGYLADRLGGINLLTLLYVGIGLILLDLATGPAPVWGMILFVTMVGLLGLGNGAVFQLVPQRFGKEIGVVTGVVGAAGGVGGFFLPTLLGGVYQLTGSYSLGFLFLALTSFVCVVVLLRLSSAWEGVFIAEGGLATGEPVPVAVPRLAVELELASQS